MNFDTNLAAGYAADKLDSLLERAQRDTTEVVQTNDIPKTVEHFAALQNTVDDLAKKISALKKHVDSLSYEILPTMFGNQNVKTIKLDDIGRVTVNVRWTASMINKQRSMEWLRTSGNEGLIIETVNAMTLASFAKTETLAGKPLPDHLFKVGTAQHMSITKE
jgi:hypothetical protein